jgi:uncharacterized membrane protein YhaH (DUF805 family)
MNKKALLYALGYCLLLILFRIAILLGGYSLTKFGYYYSTITGVFLIIPFYYLAIKDVRDRDYGGIIAGKEAMRIALTIFAVSAIITSVYHYFEYKYHGAALAEQYYNSEQFLDFLKTRTPTKPENYQKVIDEQIRDSKDAAFKATTAKLFSFMLIGLGGAFITSILMKRSPK